MAKRNLEATVIPDSCWTFTNRCAFWTPRKLYLRKLRQRGTREREEFEKKNSFSHPHDAKRGRKIPSTGLRASRPKSQPAASARCHRTLIPGVVRISRLGSDDSHDVGHTHALYYRQKPTASARLVAAEPRRARSSDLTFLLAATTQPTSQTPFRVYSD